MSSTRLPGKVMAELAGAPMIARQIERLRRAKRIDRIVLATSADPSDDPLAACVEALTRLENANDKICALRTQEMYDTMIPQGRYAPVS